MVQIHILDAETIDKIAAGEVVERPSSVVKELVENAIDAGASNLTVEVKDGGIELIRVTDNGCGMERGQLRTAFLRHATSKIEDAEDLAHISSLGFRGEALSSIAAVAKVEVITKVADQMTGSRILLEGAKEVGFDEVGAPQGTTFVVRNLFFNTPVRLKFLKQPATEGGYVTALMEQLAMSRPDVSFKFLLGGQLKFHTSGNGDLRQVIYRIHGRDVAAALVPIQARRGDMCVEGYLGKPTLVRSNRNHEIYFINGRFIRSHVVAKAVEEGYREYLMQHKFPYCVLHITMDTNRVDVNVHPTKMDVRFSDTQEVCGFLADAVRQALRNHEMIPEALLSTQQELREARFQERKEQESKIVPEPFESVRGNAYMVMEEAKYVKENPPKQDFAQNPVWSRVKNNEDPVGMQGEQGLSDILAEREEPFYSETTEFEGESGQLSEKDSQADLKKEEKCEPYVDGGVQMNLFEDKILTEDNRARFRVIGQVFGTYWLIEFEEKLLMMDQHAAHEKVNYERLIKQYREKRIVSQGLMPPVIVSLTGQEEAVLKEHYDVFVSLGFEIESFGGSEYALRGVPMDLYGCNEQEMFLEVLDELAEGAAGYGNIRVIEEKIASMSCKAAIKGNSTMSNAEAEALIDELLTLDNPYNCPHGRPIIVTMTKAEMDRKFKRIVN